MAIFNSIALGTGKKSIGNVTLLKLKGQNIAKAKITATTNRKTPAQVAQRNQLTNAVKTWPFMKAFMSLIISQKRSVESLYNVYVRLFVNSVLDTVPALATAIVASIPNGTYGSGLPITIVSAVKGATGLTVTFEPDHTIFPAGSQIKIGIVVDSDGSYSQIDQTITTANSQTALVPWVNLTGETLDFIGSYGVSQDGMTSGAITVSTTIQA
jgi:hypothetical protein